MDLQQTIEIVPELLNLFLFGFVFITLYNWLNNRKMELYIVGLWSLFVNLLIKSSFALLHQYILRKVVFSEAFKNVIYALVAVVVPFLLTYVQNKKRFKMILAKIAQKTSNKDLFKDAIDNQKKTMVFAHIRGTGVYYVGALKMREENGTDSYILLLNYSVNSEADDSILYSSDNLDHSVAVLNLQDIDRLELVYEDDSEVWEFLNKDCD